MPLTNEKPREASHAGAGTPGDGPPTQQPTHRRRWIIVAGVACAIVLLAVTAFVTVFVVREDPGARPLSDALDEFRGTDSTAPPPESVTRPPDGVYTAVGEGREALSFPPLSQHDGDVMPVTVTYMNDACWAFAIDFNDAHRQTWRYCPGDVDGSIVERGSETEQRWDLGAMTISNSTTFGCDPPALMLAAGAVTGQTWDHSCAGTNSEIPGTTRSEGPYRLVGVEPVVIEGTEIASHHYTQLRRLSGSQTGEYTTELWVAIDTGLPLRSERTVNVRTSSPVGDITYTEDGWWQLQSRVPTR
jgi:hypothetical protein